MYTGSLLLAAASIVAFATTQSTSTMLAVSVISDGQPQAPTGHARTITISSYSAHPPSYTPSSVNTATMSMPPFAAAPSYTSSILPSVVSSAYAVPTNYNSTTAPIVTASGSPTSNYTMASSAMAAPSSLSSLSSAAVVATTSGPTVPISSTNAGAFKRVASTGLALVVAGSLFIVL